MIKVNSKAYLAFFNIGKLSRPMSRHPWITAFITWHLFKKAALVKDLIKWEVEKTSKVEIKR